MKDWNTGRLSDKQLKLSGSHLYFLAMIIYLFRAELVTTNFASLIDTQMLRAVANIAVIILILAKIILFDRYTAKELLFSGGVLLLGSMIAFVSGYDVALITFLFVVGAKSVSFYKIVRLHFVYALFFVVAAFLASQAGIIENTITYRGSIPRQSFGIIYCTDFASHVFYLMVSYVYLRGNKLRHVELALLSVLVVWIYINCNARLDCACMAVLIVLLVIRKIKSSLSGEPIYALPKYPWLEKIMAWAMPICAVISIGLAYLFAADSAKWSWLNEFFNNRLIQGAKALSMYSFNLFGQIVEVQGQVGDNASLSEYFFIDSSFLLYGLRYGLVFLCFFCAGSTFMMMREIKRKNAIFCILFLLISVNSIFAHHLTELAYNPFLLFFFAQTEIYPTLNVERNRRRVRFKVR